MVRCHCNKLARCLSVPTVGCYNLQCPFLRPLTFSDLGTSCACASSITTHHHHHARVADSPHLAIYTCPRLQAIRTCPCPRHHMDGRPESRHGQPCKCVVTDRDLDKWIRIHMHEIKYIVQYVITIYVYLFIYFEIILIWRNIHLRN